MFSSSIQRYKKNSVTDLVLKLRKLFSKVLKIKPRWLQIFRFGYFGKKRIFFHGLLTAEKKNTERYGFWGLLLFESRFDTESARDCLLAERE